jgi:hypothetical protein
LGALYLALQRLLDLLYLFEFGFGSIKLRSGFGYGQALDSLAGRKAVCEAFGVDTLRLLKYGLSFDQGLLCRTLIFTGTFLPSLKGRESIGLGLDSGDRFA